MCDIFAAINYFVCIILTIKFDCESIGYYKARWSGEI